MNNVVLIGRLTRDPELRYIPNSGAAVCNFTLAVDRQYSRARKEELEARNQPTADFIRIVVWNKMAENCAEYLAQGRLVAVQGRIQTGSYTDKDGKRVYTSDVVAENVEFLEWGDRQPSQDAGYQRDASFGGDQSPGGFDTQGSDFSDIQGFQPTDNDDEIPF